MATATGLDHGYGKVDGEHAGWEGRAGASVGLCPARTHPLWCVPPRMCMVHRNRMHMRASASSRAA